MDDCCVDIIYFASSIYGLVFLDVSEASIRYFVRRHLGLLQPEVTHEVGDKYNRRVKKIFPKFNFLSTENTL